MNELNVNKSETVKQFTINGDPNNILEFDPGDVLFSERFYRVVSDMDQKRAEYAVKMNALNQNPKLDSLGIPVSIPQSLALMRELCEYMRGQIDDLFGKGTSQRVFGDALNIQMISQFFAAITPAIGEVRAQKSDQYKPNKRGKAMAK